MEKLADALKILLEKHLIPTVLSIVVAVIVYLNTPMDCWIIERISKAGYYLFVAGTLFLLIQLIVFLFKALSNKYDDWKRDKDQRLENEHEAMESLWSLVDSCSEKDRQILYEFLNNSNKPIERDEFFYYSNTILNNRELVHCRITTHNGMSVYQYVLDQAFYDKLRYSLKKYKRICHFNDCV